MTRIAAATEVDMRNCRILLAISMLAGSMSIGAQARPDFAGTWMLVHEDDIRGEPMGAFGEVFVATQSSANLVIDWHSTGPAGRGESGKLVYRPVRSEFPFDGTESNITTIAASGAVTRIIDTAAWDAGTLVVTTTWRGNLPAYVSRKRTLSLGTDGMLIVETSTRPQESGAPWPTVHSRYRRSDRVFTDERFLR